MQNFGLGRQDELGVAANQPQASLPACPLIGLLLRLVYKHYAQSARVHGLRRAPAKPARPQLGAGVPHERGGSVKPVTHATAARVDERWAELTGPEELEALRASLLRLATELRAD
jgi:hypothetical protein